MSNIRKIEAQLAALSKQLESLKARQLAQKPERGRWWIGNETSTDELIAKVRECITDRPRTLAELSELIGASRPRISGAIVRLQVNGVSVTNLGNRYRALWWIPPGK